MLASAAALVLATVTPLAPAAEPPADAPAQPAAAPLSDLARSTLDRAAKACAAIDTYQDRYVTEYHVRTKSKPDQDSTQGNTYTTTASYARGKGFHLELDYGDGRSMQIISDLKTVWSVWPEGSEYIEERFPASVRDAMASSEGYFSYIAQHPVLSILVREPRSADEVFRYITVTGAQPEQRAGRGGVRITGTHTSPRSEGGPRPISLWIADDTGLPEELRIDETETYRQQIAAYEAGGGSPDDWDGPAAADLAKAEWVSRFEDRKVNGPVDASRFAFKPTQGETKVARFGESAGEESEEESPQMDLVGRPAPGFTGTLLDGTEFTLESLKGRVVVMDFWATWCGPCVQAIPSIQKLSERYKDQPVTVIGINQDQGDTSKVRAFVERRKITFAQFMDKDGSTGNLYEVEGIPTTVILDKDGVIQDIHVGGAANLDTMLAEKVDRLLKGEKLAEAKPADAPRKKAEKADFEALVPAVDPGRLVDGERSSIPVSPVSLRGQRTVAGEQFIMTTPDGRLVIAGPGPAEMRTIKLKGVGRTMIQGAEAAELGGVRGWVVAMTDYSGSGSRSRVAFFDDHGEKVWSYDPPRAPGCFANAEAAVGDVTGDGRDEVVVGLSYMPSGRGGRADHAAFLTVLDGAGEPIVTRRIGSSVYGLWIAPAPSGGGARTVMVVGEGIQRFTLSPEAGSKEAAR